MQTFSHLSAKATLCTFAGVSEVKYAGLVCNTSLTVIRGHVTALRPRVLMSRFDKCLLLMRSIAPVTSSVYAGWASSGVMVATDEQYEMCREFASQVARVGLMRVVFRASQLELAREFAADQALAMRQ